MRRSYVPSQQIEEMRLIVSKQMEIGGKISAVKNQIHALLERNLLQSEFDDLSDIFGVEGLERLSAVELPKNERPTLATYLQELGPFTSQYRQMETEMVKVAEADSDCQNLMSHPGIASFVAVAIKARAGDASRFPTKRHFCSYAGVVPNADNSAERISEHNHVKHGDEVLKYALTCGVNAAVRAGTDSAVKSFYLKQVAKRKSPQDAQGRLRGSSPASFGRSSRPSRDISRRTGYLTARKLSRLSRLARRPHEDAAKPEDVPALIAGLKSEADVLEKYPEGMRRETGHRRHTRSDSSRGRATRGGAVAR